MMIRAAIIGASGYTGLELIKILISHPGLRISYVATSEGGVRLCELHPSLEGIYECQVEEANATEAAKYADIAFLALPHKTAMSFAKELVDLGIKVVDLSADYRLELETYEKHYCSHQDPGHLGEAVYGLPEFFRDEIKKTRLLANPGCYPTATLLGIAPFLPHIDENAPLFVDAKSGVSGAGKKCVSTTHFVTINENIFAYNPISHRHAPEIAEKLRVLSGKDFSVTFVPHLLSVTRGMLVSIYATLKEKIDPIAVLSEYYKNEPFVRIRKEPVDIKSVSGTHFCDIFAQSNGKALFVSSAIDNLLRGASSQAVVNANLMMGYEESTAIPKIAYVP